MATAGVSQASSPRLPSPPPFTEVQIGPKSPSVGESFDSETEQLLGASQIAEDGSTRRIRPGTRAIDMAFGPPLIPLSQLDSPFQLQEHLKALYNHFTRPEGSDTIIPISRDVAIQLAEPPEGVDRSLWLYELCRFLTMKVNNLIVAFFADSPPCSAQTCPEMRASEWQYLCAVHDPPKACCAIDYCCHTLDWATNILTSPKYFPSRLTLGAEGGGGAQASMRHLTNIFRRLYRIFAHAWFQHREVFWQVEGHDGLYIFFKTVCDMYSLIPEDNYTVPAEAEGLDTVQQQQQPAVAAAAGATTGLEHGDGRRVTILRKENEPFPVSMEPVSISTGATTRRHKGSSSISSGVTTINESAEDDEQPKQQAVAAANAAVAAAAAAAGGQSKPQPAPEATDEPKQVAEQTSPGSPASQVTVAEVHAEEPEPAPQTETETEPEPEPESKAEKNAEAAGEAAEEAVEEEQPKEAEVAAKNGAEEAPTEETTTEEPIAADESSTKTTEAEPAQKE